MASQEGHVDVVEMLLESEADVDHACTNDGATPLYSAALMGWAGVVQVLLREGADPTKLNTIGSSPLDAATQGGHRAIMDLLAGHVRSGYFP